MGYPANGGALQTRRRRRAGAAVLFLLSAMLLALAVPRLLAGVTNMAGDVVAFDIRYDRPVTRRDLGVLIATRSGANGWLSAPANYREISVATYRLALLTDDAAVRADLFEQARAASSTAIAMAPADPFMWAIRSQALVQLGGDRQQALEDLRRLNLTGRFDPELYAERVALPLVLWDLLDENDRAQASEAARALVDARPEALAAMGSDQQTRTRVMGLLADRDLIARYLDALNAATADSRPGDEHDE